MCHYNVIYKNTKDKNSVFLTAVLLPESVL